MTNRTFDYWLLRLATAHDIELTAERVAIYREALADLGDEAFARGMAECLLSVKYFPKVAEIRESAQRRHFTDDHGEPIPDFRNIDAWRDDRGIVRPRLSLRRLLWPDHYHGDGNVREYMSGKTIHSRGVAL